jgi:hypothetical protein
VWLNQQRKSKKNPHPHPVLMVCVRSPTRAEASEAPAAGATTSNIIGGKTYDVQGMNVRFRHGNVTG